LSGGDVKKLKRPTYVELEARLAACERARAGQAGLAFKIAKKGGVSVYRLGRFPVTLYYEQWIRLLDSAGMLRTFLEQSKQAGKLKVGK
jgi:hypothetical protein